ncbi:IS200/IS605 family transposase [Streptomyces sp. NPDC005227]|uniref:IS200/IS605 family transposase n=1 Tax=unclassified Streptomyces TaxID=2593676 RepID=UPI0036ACEDFB
MHVHLAFGTKYRHRVRNDEMPTVCETTMRKVCVDFEAELFEFNGEHDHVHLLVHQPPKVGVSGLVNSLKASPPASCAGTSPGHVNRAIMHGHLWSPSYFAASCGGAPLTVVRQCIEQQRRPL